MKWPTYCLYSFAVYGIQNVDFLKHFKDKLVDLAKYMVLETYTGKKTIVEQGSEGDKFYFILDGKVSIYIKSFNDMTGNEFFVAITLNKSL